MAAEQLSELSHGRTDVFINSGNAGGSGSRGGTVDGAQILSSADISSLFQLEIGSLSMNGIDRALVAKEGISQISITISLHLALGQLCPQRTIIRDLPVDSSSSSSSTKGKGRRMSSVSSHLRFHDEVVFDISVKDLPRAARILFRVGGLRKKPKGAPLMPLGWTAVTVFDFKACMDGSIDLKLFAGDNSVPINTTLSNANEKGASSLTALLAPDVMMNNTNGSGKASGGGGGSGSGKSGHNGNGNRAKIVHGLSSSGTLDLGDAAANVAAAEAHREELNRILLMSFNPMSTSIFSEADKEFLWDLRYSILNRAEMLPPFVMSVQWQRSERVQELYDLLDVWLPPSPVQALQLLDRRFLDPKVRAYAVHCLEELSDEELALYMLQLCQQLKFESSVDSALSRFLLRRALSNRRVIGHIFFWLLQSEVYNIDVKRRYTILLQVFIYFTHSYSFIFVCFFLFFLVSKCLHPMLHILALLQIYITNCGHHRVELGQQMFIMKRLEHVAAMVLLGESKSARLLILRQTYDLLVSLIYLFVCLFVCCCCCLFFEENN